MKKNLLKLFSLLAISCCFVLPACSSNDNQTNAENEGVQNAENAAESTATATTTEDILDIESEASATNSSTENNNTLKSLLSSVLSSVSESLNLDLFTNLLGTSTDESNDDSENTTIQYLNKLKELLDNHFNEVNNESLENILEKLKDGEASEEDLSEIKNYLENNGIDFTSLKLTNSEKEKILQYVVDNKDTINDRLQKYKLDNLDYSFMMDLIEKLLNN